MSSRELLVLLRFMDDRGAYKTALRGGEWPAEIQIAKTTANEVSKLRASYHNAHDDSYEPALWLSPGEIAEQAAENAAGQILQADMYSQMFPSIRERR